MSPAASPVRPRSPCLREPLPRRQPRCHGGRRRRPSDGSYLSPPPRRQLLSGSQYLERNTQDRRRRRRSRVNPRRRSRSRCNLLHSPTRQCLRVQRIAHHRSNSLPRLRVLLSSRSTPQKKPQREMCPQGRTPLPPLGIGRRWHRVNRQQRTRLAHSLDRRRPRRLLLHRRRRRRRLRQRQSRPAAWERHKGSLQLASSNP
jgi:hypothetical protein